MKINEKSLYFKLYNSTDIVKEVNKVLYNKIFGESVIAHGGYGAIYIPNIPNNIIYNGIKYKNIVVKEHHDFEDEFGVKYLSYDGKKWNYYVKDSDILIKSNSSISSEMLISLLISSLFIDGISPHFVVTLGVTTSGIKPKILYENLITKIDIKEVSIMSVYNPKNSIYVTDIDNIINYFKYKKLKISEQLIDHCIISVLHSMYLLYSIFNFIHGDLHARNIFIKDISKGKYFQGKETKNIKYIQYKINNDVSLYTKFYGFFLKIGDFGLSKLAMKRKNGKFIYITNTSNTIFKEIYPNYPFKYKNHYPDYFYFIRFMARNFIGISKLISDLSTKLPELSTQPYILNFVQFINIKKLINLDEILTSNMFNKYKNKYKGMNKSNTLVVNYKF